MEFIRENARQFINSPIDVLKSEFKDLLNKSVDASYLNIEEKRILGVVGLDFYAPICEYLLNNSDVYNFVMAKKESQVIILLSNDLKVVTKSGERKVSKAIKNTILSIHEVVMKSPGYIDENGCHIIDLKANKIGTHFDVNLLIGNRVGFDSPLLTTPKGAIDSLGRGSFRASAAKQVTSTRYTLIPEFNGEPVNRQFYIIEDGKQTFYSADINTNVKKAFCKHAQNYTEISYETEDDLKITRTLYIMPYEDGMPEAVETQIVNIENLSSKKRNISIVFTGMLGLASPESMMNDLIYASVTWESSLIKSNGKIIAVSPNPHPGYLKPHKRFALLFDENGNTLDGYCSNYADFIGNGSLEKPQKVSKLDSVQVSKMVSFYAISKELVLKANSSAVVNAFTGIVNAKGGSDEIFFTQLSNLVEKYKVKKNVIENLEKVKLFASRYANFLKIKSSDKELDRYINNNLPFQVYYQSYVSRSFAWTQKSYREIGFREIQDMYASLYYITGMGENKLARDMLSMWVKNVYKMGYANHNFYSVGKEPGMCSDDGLWLSQAIYRYVSLTGDNSFLYEKYPVCGCNEERTVLDTLLATVEYSGTISVGKHGFPILDKADWNDCLKLDDEWINGVEKERQYNIQISKEGHKYGEKYKNNFSESIMNAFLLKIAYDNIIEMCNLVGEKETVKVLTKKRKTLCDNIAKYAWNNDFYARAMVGGNREYTYLGGKGDGLSDDNNIDGTYWLNSFSWSILSGVATEEQIAIMIKNIKKYLLTPAGVKLCTPSALGKLSNGNASSSYFPGDRENGGVFKHAEMMCASACLKAAKVVKSNKLAKELSELAYIELDSVLPYKTFEHPYITKGNPRFCTQYNNSQTGENIGPMLSGTASWLNLTTMDMIGFEFKGDDIVISPIIPFDMKEMNYTIDNNGTIYNVNISKKKGFGRFNASSKITIDKKASTNVFKRFDDGKVHSIEVKI